jgi:hypothetical protein
MRFPAPIILLLVMAAACGGGADAGPAPGDYFAQLHRVSETAHIQERGLRRDLRLRLEEAASEGDRMAALTVFVDQSARLYQDVVDALEDLDPPEELAAAQRAFLDGWRHRLDLIVAIRDEGLRDPDAIVGALEPATRNAAVEIEAACDDLQAAVAASGSDVDLVCDGRPS